MDKNEIKHAFGATPQSFRDQVNHTIDALEDKPMKKRYKLTTLLAAALAVALAGTAAVAAFNSQIRQMYQNTENGLANDAVLPGIQTLHETYEGKAVRCTMQEALYDGEGGTYALSWELVNLTGEETLYVVCDALTFDGERGDTRSEYHVSEFFLPQGTTVATTMGELPDNSASHCELSLSILRATGPYAQDGDGFIPLDDRYYSALSEGSRYSDLLVEHANFEIADRFKLSFDMDREALGSTAKYLTGDSDFKLDGCELNVTFGEITATKAHIVVEYISDTEILDGGKGIGPYYDSDFALPNGDIWWTGNSGGTLGDPEQLPDGHWRSVYDWEAVELFAQPDALDMTLTTYATEDGVLDLDSPVAHEKVTLRFQ